MKFPPAAFLRVEFCVFALCQVWALAASPATHYISQPRIRRNLPLVRARCQLRETGMQRPGHSALCPIATCVELARIFIQLHVAAFGPVRSGAGPWRKLEI